VSHKRIKRFIVRGGILDPYAIPNSVVTRQNRFGVVDARSLWAFERHWGKQGLSPAGDQMDKLARRIRETAMRRRVFNAGLGSAAAWPVVARAQQDKVWRVGYLNPSSPTKISVARRI